MGVNFWLLKQLQQKLLVGMTALEYVEPRENEYNAVT